MSFRQRGTPSAYLAQSSVKGQLKPFHSAIIPPELLRINEFERGFSSSLGTTFEECARIIALEHHLEAHRSYDLTGETSLTAINEIEHQVAQFEHAAESGTRRPSLQQMIKAVLKSRQKSDWVRRAVRADLYVLARDGTQFFFELKSPMPNKGQCLEVIQRLLRFHLLSGKARPNVQAYFAMAYNPYGPTRKDYRWSFAVQYTPFEQAVIIGYEFWNIIGGPTTYEELVGIYQEVGRDKSKYMLDALAFGF